MKFRKMWVSSLILVTLYGLAPNRPPQTAIIRVNIRHRSDKLFSLNRVKKNIYIHITSRASLPKGKRRFLGHLSTYFYILSRNGCRATSFTRENVTTGTIKLYLRSQLSLFLVLSVDPLSYYHIRIRAYNI